MKKQPQKKNVTPTKLAVIGGLVLVLLVVWGGAFSGAKDVSVVNQEQTKLRPIPNAIAQANRVALPKLDAFESQKPLPPIAVEQATQHDPFERPQWASDGSTPSARKFALDEEQTMLDQLREQGADMVMISGTQKRASVAGQEILVGDRLADYEVVDITPQGVVLSELPAR